MRRSVVARPIETLEARRMFSASLPASTVNALAYDRSGNLHAAYVDVTDGMLMYARRVAGDWSTPVVIESVGAASAGAVAIGVGPTGQVDVAYDSRSTGQLKFATSAGSTWRIATIDAKASAAIEPVLGFQKNGTPLVVYYNPTKSVIDTATQAKKGWKIAATGGAIGVTPALAVNPVNRNLSAAFEDKQGKIHVGAIGPGGIGGAKVINKAGAIKNDLSLAFGPKATPEVSYYDPAARRVSLLSIGPKNKPVTTTVADVAGDPDAGLYVSSTTGAVRVLYADGSGGLAVAQASAPAGAFTATPLDHGVSTGPFAAAAAADGSLTYGFDRDGSSNWFVSRTTTTPLPPTGLNASAEGFGQITLAWDAVAGNVSGFQVLRSSDGQTFTTIATVDPSARSYTDTGLSPTTYYYRVRAVGGDGSTSQGISAGGANSAAVAAVAIQSIAGRVYADATDSGLYAPGDTGIVTTLTLDGTDTGGHAVHRTTTSDTSGGYVFITVPAGTYTITESEPAGYLPGLNNPTHARSGLVMTAGGKVIGVDFGELAGGTIAGAVYIDANHDFHHGSNEPGIAGVAITLSGTDDVGAVIDSTVTTEPDGSYSFTMLRPGTYTVTEAAPGGFLPSENGSGVVSNVAVAAGSVTTAGFGQVPPTIGFQGFVYVDANDDGTFTSVDTGLESVTIDLVGTDDHGRAVQKSTTTAADGSYSFPGLVPGDYSLSMTAPGGYLPGLENSLGTITAAAWTLTNDFGLITPSTAGGIVFRDANNDDNFDGNDNGLANVSVVLSGVDDRGATVHTTATTGPDGRYSFTNLRPGTYQFQEGGVAGFTPSAAVTTAGVSGVRVVSGAVIGVGSSTEADFPETVPTRITVVPTGTLAPAGQSVAISVTVASMTGPTPTGTVDVYDGQTRIDSDPLDGTGHVTFSTDSLPVGLHSIHVVYQGDSVYTLDTSAVISGAITPLGVTVNTTLSATAVSGTGIDLSWGDDGISHSGFAVFRTAAGAPAAVIATIPGTARSFSDRGLVQGVSYTYQVVASDDGTPTNVSSATTLLPAPAYLGPAVEPAYPAGFATFSPPVSAAISAGVGSPRVDEFTRTATADSTIAVTAESLTHPTIGTSGAGAGFLTYGQTSSTDGTLADGALQTLDGRAASVTLPAALPSQGLYFVWAKNTDASGVSQYSAPMVVNRPELYWLDDTQAYAGGTLSVFGRNLSHNPGGQSGDSSWIYIQPEDGTAGQWVHATAGDVNPYKVDFSLPTNLPVGSYTVWVNNGLSGHYGWSNSLQLTTTDPPLVIRKYVTEMTEDGIYAAMLQPAYPGVIVDIVIPDGTITLTSPLLMLGDRHLVGSGHTILQVPAGAGLNEAVDLGYEGYTGVENLSIVADDGAISLTSVNDGRAPAVIQLGGVFQVLNDITVSDVNPGGRSAVDVNCLVPENLRVTGCTFVGPGLHFSGCDDLVIDRCDFVGAGAGDSAINMLNGSDLSVTHCTFSNYSDDPTQLYESTARVFWLGSSGNRVYLGDNTSVNLFPEAVISSGLNGGEQILTESTMTAWEGAPVGAGGSTVTVPAAAGAPGLGWTVTVGGGTGMGQTRIITAAATAAGGIVLSLDRPWNVAPSADSTLVMGTTCDGFVAYENHLSGDGDQSFRANTAGVQVGGNDVAVVDNTVTRVATGIALWSSSKYGTYGAGLNASLSTFAVIDHNTVTDVQYGLRPVGASTAPSEPVPIMFADVWRGNTVADVLDLNLGEDLPTGISVSISLVAPDRQVTTNVFEHNTITAPIGITFTAGGNQGPVADAATVATLVRGNTLTSDGSGGVGLLANVTEAGFADVVDNTVTGFTTPYVIPASAAAGALVVPARAVSVTVGANTTASAVVGIKTTVGGGAWSLSTSGLPTWVQIPASPAVVGDATVPVQIDSTGLPVGTYVTTLHLLLGGAPAVDVLLTLTVVN